MLILSSNGSGVSPLLNDRAEHQDFRHCMKTGFSLTQMIARIIRILPNQQEFSKLDTARRGWRSK